MYEHDNGFLTVIQMKILQACPLLLLLLLLYWVHSPVYIGVWSGAVASNSDFDDHLSVLVLQHSGHVFALPFVRENGA